jgi:mannose/cellobiose epimerase-like protein (N-acyl-D-glucosamine 2-epimerase family)
MHVPCILALRGRHIDMTQEEEPLVEARLAALRGRLLEWLVGAAYPLWARQGIDPHNGGFVETLGQDALPRRDARRVRVQPRQVSAFAHATSLGWRGDVPGIVRAGMDYLAAHYRRGDGFYRTLVSADGASLDDRALLYDQAFVLLGFSKAAVVLDARAAFERRALDLRDAIARHWRSASGGFCCGEVNLDRRESNPHMHLLEACLAWSEIGNDAGWAAWVEELADLALARFVHPQSGALGESFTAEWDRAPGTAGRIIEPGHQFKWAWLLLRCRRRNGPARVAQALRLIAIAEESGVRGDVAVNALLDDFSIHDPNARLWPQTERLKSTLLAAFITGEARYLTLAAQAAASLFPYLETAVAGLWFDVQLPNGALLEQPSPASTFYHLVGAIAALDASQRARF